MSDKRIKTQVSGTASFTCFCRACAEAERDERFRGPDTIAREFVPRLPTVLFLKCRPVGKLVMKRVAPRGIYEYVTARTRLIDEVFADAIVRAVPQIIIFGAGFDTRAWRFASRNRGTQIFELDAPVTQEMKKKLLAERGIPVPGNVTFVPVDFQEQDTGTTLDAAGYRRGLRGLYLLEGVTMYLDWKSVAATFDFIRDTSAPGSRVVFDYVLASVLRKERNLYGEAAISKLVSRQGERWTFGIEQGRIKTFLARHGFRQVEHYTPAELQKKYLTADDGTSFGRINETHCIALAAVGNDKKK